MIRDLPGGSGRIDAALSPAAAATAGAFFANPEAISLHSLAIQSGNCCPGFVTFHVDKSKTTATAGEDVTGELIIEHAAKFREQFIEFFFVHVAGQIPNT
jgi:hypothetical protein